MLTLRARAEGARQTVGNGRVTRPGGATDVMIVIDRLHRAGRLNKEHLHVLAWYGKRQIEPDDTRPKEYRAAQLWREAMAVIGPALEGKGLVRAVPGAFTGR